MSKQNESTIEEDLAALRELVEWFESDDFALEQAIEKYQQAERLAHRIDQRLTKINNKITVIDQESANIRA